MLGLNSITTEPTDRTPDWLITYSDLMTLLLVMFVLLFSLSEFKQSEKFQGVARSIHAKFGRPDRPAEEAAQLDAIISSNLRAAHERRTELLGEAN
ncbi:flagellar motor protein MotS [Anatilimnocola aggregata]|uniref:Flagellar motor protein MotS n=1 Tax=Anatilimnocola aggregata TaxID=2528021 RepID=A0A517Y9W8_9BACT|nr:flagellar motor protein MotB [Anatilimnocola aggregata]QDU26962.1 flagellar motor protein MotS [Anatilimnocola aggregata]